MAHGGKSQWDRLQTWDFPGYLLHLWASICLDAQWRPQENKSQWRQSALKFDASFSNCLVSVLMANVPMANNAKQTVINTMPTCKNWNLLKSIKVSIAALTTMGNETNMRG
jgi:hypothetical protein